MNTNKRPPLLNEVTREQPELSRLFRIAGTMERLTGILNQAVPDVLKGSVQIRTYKDKVLSVNVPSGSSATLFRMEMQTIKTRLRNHPSFQHLSRINVKVKPDRQPAPKKREPMRLSKKNAQLLLEEAGHTEDKDLKYTLEKLARRGLLAPD
ncbi:hypothetical protein OLMES_4690 [Oleiphilus messinensis]|uniref:DUF721 domain-containing protein n=1 Tax=Oleiphilus messinensis TaxID=141451 RepID=A0A1Y0IGN2_9GAMM|nr:DciA family protein [Oleiphilus messinensis]ARU58685.1 hypothetical protein OLMES_4690 [Oleiphilus messinensis]